MKLGFVSAILPDFDLPDVLNLASSIGYDCVELMCWPPGKAERRYAGVTHFDVTQVSDADVAQFHDLVQSYGVFVSGLGYYPNPLSPNNEESATAIAHLQQVIQAAQRIGLRQVNTFVGRDWTKHVDDNWPRFLEVWRPMVQFAERHEIRIGIENCPMSFSKDEWPGGKNLAISPAIWERMFNDIPSDSFGLNYDPSHMVWQQMDYLNPLQTFRDRIFHVHAKDVRVNRHCLDHVGILATPLEYHSPKLPGLGDVDWGAFFSTLGDTGYNGPVCVEVEDRAFETSDSLRRVALEQSHNYLRNFVAKR